MGQANSLISKCAEIETCIVCSETPDWKKNENFVMNQCGCLGSNQMCYKCFCLYAASQLDAHINSAADGPLSQVCCPTCREAIDVHPIGRTENDRIAYQNIEDGAKGIMARIGTLDARVYYSWKWAKSKGPVQVSTSKAAMFFFLLYIAAQISFVCGAFIIGTSARGNDSISYLPLEMGGSLVMISTYHVMLACNARHLLNCIRARITGLVSMVLAVWLHSTAFYLSTFQLRASETVMVANFTTWIVVVLVGVLWVFSAFSVWSCTPECFRECNPLYVNTEDLCSMIPCDGIKIQFVPLHGHCKGWTIETYILPAPKVSPIAILCTRVSDASARRERIGNQ
jgi:hypothetical protein